MKIPFFHYTSLDNLPKIIVAGRLISRAGLNNKKAEFIDISIDPAQTIRRGLRLLNYIPLFAGFHGFHRSYQLSRFMTDNDYSSLCNKTFYGALNKTLRPKLTSDYGKIIILLINNELVFQFADYGKIRFFNDIAIRSNSTEIPVTNRKDLEKCLTEGVEGENILGEIDLLDDGKVSIECTSDIEAIIVDNEKIKGEVINIVNEHKTTGKTPSTLVSKLPRGPIPPVRSYRITPTDRQVAFAKYVEDLKRQGITGGEFREKRDRWLREHKES